MANKELKKYFITYGTLSTEYEIIEAISENEANNYAYEQAKEDYTMYEGYHGVQSREDIADEEELDSVEDEEIIEDIYREAVENQISYSAELYDSKKHGDYLY